MNNRRSPYLRPEVTRTPFCPGCGHGILMGAVIRAVERLRIPKEDLLFVSGIGCAGWIPSPHFDTDTLHALHGRAIPFATGAKLANPRITAVVVSGDGDLANIGGNHLIHGARRDVDLTVVCANNQVFGMTGGQPSATADGEPLSTGSPAEHPFDLTDLVIAAGARYAACFPVTQPEALSRAVERAVATPGFTFVEALCPCVAHAHGHGIEEIYDALEARCISQEEADTLTEEARKARIVIGELTP